jgi:putative exosortase-associated protein (TIGR04073 family)
MKKGICFLLIIAQVFLFSISAEAKYRKSPKAQETPAVQSQTEDGAAKATPANKEQPTKPKATRPLFSRPHLTDQNPLRKIARGASNTTLGWLEIPRQTIRVSREKGEIGGTFWGPLKGFAYFIGRTAVGIYEVTTFLLPPYKSVVEPEFIFADDEPEQ